MSFCIEDYHQRHQDRLRRTICSHPSNDSAHRRRASLLSSCRCRISHCALNYALGQIKELTRMKNRFCGSFGSSSPRLLGHCAAGNFSSRYCSRISSLIYPLSLPSMVVFASSCGAGELSAALPAMSARAVFKERVQILIFVYAVHESVRQQGGRWRGFAASITSITQEPEQVFLNLNADHCCLTRPFGESSPALSTTLLCSRSCLNLLRKKYAFARSEITT